MPLFPLFANKDLKALILNINITETGKKNRKAAIKLARELLRHVTRPGVACTDDGKVTLYWDNNVRIASIEVQLDGSYFLYLYDRTDQSNRTLLFNMGDVNARWVATYLAPFLHPLPNAQ